MAGELGDGQLKGMKVVAHVNRHKSEIRRPLDEGCPESIQPHTMKNRDIY